MNSIAELKKQIKGCALCEEPVIHRGFHYGGFLFCCQGCQAVHSILEAQGALNQKKEHPLLKTAAQYGLISNPHLIEKLKKEEKESLKWVFEVGCMWCPSCAELIRLVLCQKSGVLKCYVDYVTDLASVQFDPTMIWKEEIKKVIENLGYSVREIEDVKDKAPYQLLLLRFALAAFCSLNVMMFTYPLYTTFFDFDAEGLRPLLAWTSLILTLPVLAFSAAPLFKRCTAQLKTGAMGMESLVATALIAALFVSLSQMALGTYHVYFDTMTVVVTFLLLGKRIESKAKFSTKEALIRLQHALPRKGRKVFPGGDARFVPLKEIQAGDQLAVFAGERIGVDGTVVEGEGACDESVLTGESIPVFKKKGDQVLSGTLLKSGTLQYTSKAKEEKSTLHQILALVEQEIGEKTPYVRAADQIVKWFAPLVFALAFFSAVFPILMGYPFLEGVLRGMAVLLIACPCAIGIAAPIVEAEVIRRFAEKGALVRNRALLALLPNITHFVFDKTGTITEGHFKLLTGLDPLTDEDLMRLKGLASQSLHPIAKAVDLAIEGEKASYTSVQEISGQGLLGSCERETYYLGSSQFASSIGLCVPPVASEDSIAYFFTGTQLLTILTFGDTLRKDARKCLENLSFATRILLSGDRKEAVAKIASFLPFQEWHAEVSPLEKQQLIARLKSEGALVAMMGDGINDAPALAKAHAAISLVSATDISIQVSDLLITSDRLSLLPELVALAKKGSRLIQQNLFWAFFYNIVGIALAAFGLLTPLFASFAMIISSLMVLFNAKRV